MMKITTRDRERMEHTHHIAAQSLCRYRMGAIIYRGAKPISVGINIIKSHPEHSSYGPHVISIHAEHRAILRARVDVTGSTLYIARDGGTTSKPCASCRAYMQEAGIAVVVYMAANSITKEFV